MDRDDYLRSTVIFLPALLIAAVSFALYSPRFCRRSPPRKIWIRVDPVNPDSARKMKLNGAGKVQIVLSPIETRRKRK